MSKESIVMVYDANNIKFERCELYNDFVQTLLRVVFETYLGDEITDDMGKLKHFYWCWDKTVNNFKKEGIIFESDKLKNYFLEFIIQVFYSVEKNETTYSDKDSLKLWSDLFDYSKQKTNSDMDTFIEIYKIFEKSQKTV
jgi:hypothetical protein